tara:strand:+ start:63 stop:989 length:927 start_codon:yes stop_codon:yes gene_type:complete
MISVVFPGQGSQKVGMGSDFYNQYEYVKKLFDYADDILGYKISDIILNGPQEKLNQTTFTQPAIYLIGYVICEILKKETNFFKKNFNFFAGHSLGEYTALTAANVLTFEQGLLLLSSRGEAMQSAVPLGEGGMSAVLGLDSEELKKLIKENFSEIKCYLANDNSNGQFIVSGLNKELKKFNLLCQEKKIKNIPLSVSAPFHCELMRNATVKMESIIKNQKFSELKYKVVSNVTAKKYNNSDEVKKLLIAQIEETVRWRESIKYMITEGTSTFIEIGPGKVLSGLIKRINKEVKVLNIDKVEDIQSLNI